MLPRHLTRTVNLNGGVVYERIVVEQFSNDQLLECIISTENVGKAWKQVRSNKGAPLILACIEIRQWFHANHASAFAVGTKGDILSGYPQHLLLKCLLDKKPDFHVFSYESPNEKDRFPLADISQETIISDIKIPFGAKEFLIFSNNFFLSLSHR